MSSNSACRYAYTQHHSLLVLPKCHLSGHVTVLNTNCGDCQLVLLLGVSWWHVKAWDWFSAHCSCVPMLSLSLNGLSATSAYNQRCPELQSMHVLGNLLANAALLGDDSCDAEVVHHYVLCCQLLDCSAHLHQITACCCIQQSLRFAMSAPHGPSCLPAIDRPVTTTWPDVSSSFRVCIYIPLMFSFNYEQVPCWPQKQRYCAFICPVTQLQHNGSQVCGNSTP